MITCLQRTAVPEVGSAVGLRGKKVVKHDEVLESKEPGPQVKTVFQEEGKALHQVWELEIYSCDLLVKPLQHLCVTRHSMYFWRKGLPVSVMLRFVGV